MKREKNNLIIAIDFDGTIYDLSFPEVGSTNDTLNNVRTIVMNLDINFKDTREIESDYKKGFKELMCYFDSISDEEKPKLHKRLKN